MTVSEQWPTHLPVVAVRVARPTDRLEAVVTFYRDGLGLPVIDSFEGHAGYSGVMLGLPGSRYHLEFTHYEGGVIVLPHRKTICSCCISRREQRWSILWRDCVRWVTHHCPPRIRIGVHSPVSR